jgi:1-acyl-sn-glycerol-3-phosphate acyltransferase
MCMQEFFFGVATIKIPASPLDTNPPHYPAWESLLPVISSYERVKLIVGTITFIAPMRFLIIWYLLAIGWLLCCIAPGNSGKSDLNRVKRFARRVVVFLIRFGCRLILFVAGFYFVFTRGSFDKKARIIVATHHSIWDTLWLIWDTGAGQTAKLELFQNAVIGAFLELLESIPVDRHSRTGRKSALEAIKLRSKLSDAPLLVFPTGACSNCRELMVFKRGAFECGVPIQPVGIAYLARHFDMTLTRWPLWDLYRTMCQFTNFLAVTYLPISNPIQSELDDPALWSRTTRETMASEMCMQQVPFSLENEIVRTRCRDLGVIYNETKCTVSNLSLALSVVDTFVGLDKNKDGWIDESDFSNAFRTDSFTKILNVLKLPPVTPEEYISAAHNTNCWTEKGFTGWITGGRPPMPPRPLDPYREDAIEVAEVINHLSGNAPPDPLVANVFNLSNLIAKS